MNYKASSSSSSELGTRWATTNLSYLNYHWKLKVWFFLLKFSTANARRLTSIWQLRSFKLFIRNSNTFRLLCACGQHWTIRICSQLCTTWWWPFINILHANTMYLPCRYLILMVYFDFKGLRNYLKNMHFRSSSRTFDLISKFSASSTTTLDFGFVQAFISSQPDYHIRNCEYPKWCGINSWEKNIIWIFDVLCRFICKVNR